MLIGLLLSVVMAMICVLIHAEALAIVEKYTVRLGGVRRQLVAIWGLLLSAHVLEVWLYAGAYWAAEHFAWGQLVGIDGTVDYLYFSAVVYTTLGFGDIVPVDSVRLLAGSQALVGLCLIAWSATATYAQVNARTASRGDHSR